MFLVIVVYHNELDFCESVTSPICASHQSLVDGLYSSSFSNVPVWEYAAGVDSSTLSEDGLTLSQLPFTRVYDFGTESNFNDANGDFVNATITYEQNGIPTSTEMINQLSNVSNGQGDGTGGSSSKGGSKLGKGNKENKLGKLPLYLLGAVLVAKIGRDSWKKNWLE